MLRVAVFVGVVFSGLGGLARADLPAELDKPYKLQVVLHIAKHRQLTETFKDLLESELRDSLQAGLGKFATVEVVRQHAKLKDIIDNGLSVLDGWTDVSEVKTHFIVVDFVDGQYEVQGRQHDGLTGQPSPTIRRDRTPDRLFVARTAALMVGRDFGVVGTVTEVKDDTVRVALKASSLKLPADLLPLKNEVFALVRISESGGVRAERVDGALLQVLEDAKNDAPCLCKVWHRYVEPLEQGAGVLGYRCVKLATIKSAVRIRVMKRNAQTLTPESGLPIEVRRTNFTEVDAPVSGSTDKNGVYSSADQKDGRFEHVAFVSIFTLGNPSPKARVPIALVDDRIVVIPISIDEADNLQLSIRRNQWVAQSYDSYSVLKTQFVQLEALVNKDKKREEAIERAKQILEDVGRDIQRLVDGRARLEKDAKAEPGFKLNLAEGDQQIAVLRDGQTKLRNFIAHLEQIVRDEKDPKRQELQAKAALGPTYEAKGDYDEALKIYKEVIDSKAADQKMIDHYNQLKAAWEIKNDKHGDARKFVIEIWPKLDPLKLLENLNTARSAFEECKKVGDKLTPRRLRFLTHNHAEVLNAIVNKLDPQNKEDDRETSKKVEEISKGLLDLITDVNKFVD
jgi:tetratricopeptide (TPR) repeat protein